MQIVILWYSFSGTVYISMIPFMLGPIVPIILKFIPETILPANPNATIAKPLMFHVEYLIDVDKYYYPLVIHSYFGTMAYITVVVAIDCMFIVYVQFACSMFNIIGWVKSNNNIFLNIFWSFLIDIFRKWIDIDWRISWNLIIWCLM